MAFASAAPAATAAATALNYTNFTDYVNQLAYSMANPYPSSAAVSNGFKWEQRGRRRVRPDGRHRHRPSAAPGTATDPPFTVASNSPSAEQRKANSQKPRR